MNALLRRFFVLCLCCWLPLPAALAMTLNCHVDMVPGDNQQTSTAPRMEKSGCGSHESSQHELTQVDALPFVEKAGDFQNSSCEHCKNTCHIQPVLPVALPTAVDAPLQEPPRFALTLPQWIFIAPLQRPPQAS